MVITKLERAQTPVNPSGEKNLREYSNPLNRSISALGAGRLRASIGQRALKPVQTRLNSSIIDT